MNRTFDRLHHNLGRATVGVLIATLSIYALTLVCALMGFSHAVVSLRGVMFSLACVFGVFATVFLIASAAAGVARWMERRREIGSGQPG